MEYRRARHYVQSVLGAPLWRTVSYGNVFERLDGVRVLVVVGCDNVDGCDVWALTLVVYALEDADELGDNRLGLLGRQAEALLERWSSGRERGAQRKSGGDDSGVLHLVWYD